MMDLPLRRPSRVDGVSAPVVPSTRESGTVTAARRVLDGRGRRRLSQVLPFLGPAFIASVAYVDPGNFATNIQGGASFGYTLLWVIVASNIMAMLLQTLSAKLGIATGRSLPELCRAHFPRWMSLGLWGIAEIAAMATDLAEFLGASVGLNLLFHIPLLPAGLITGVATFAILYLQRYGFRPLEAVIVGLVGVIASTYLVETFLARPNLAEVGYHAIVPSLSGPHSVMLAVGILGATVMPHVIYLHSSLTKNRVRPRNRHEARSIFRFEQIDVWLAMGIAGLINAAMMLVAAAAFFGHGQTNVASLDTAYRTLTPLLGRSASALFGVALLASGLSSSAVGTMAGQIIMDGFVGWTIPVWLRRLLTMLPALIVIGIGLDPTSTLIISQVMLSFALPFAIVPLLHFTNQRKLMGRLVNRHATRIAGWVVATVIIGLNMLLLYTTFSGAHA